MHTANCTAWQSSASVRLSLILSCCVSAWLPLCLRRLLSRVQKLTASTDSGAGRFNTATETTSEQREDDQRRRYIMLQHVKPPKGFWEVSKERSLITVTLFQCTEVNASFGLVNNWCSVLCFRLALFKLGVYDYGQLAIMREGVVRALYMSKTSRRQRARPIRLITSPSKI